MRIRTAIGAWLLTAACGCPPRGPAAGETPAQPTSEPTTPKVTSAAAAPSAPAVVSPSATGSSLIAPTQPARAGLAARVCAADATATAPSGDLQAMPVPGTEPGALDPNDKVFHLYEGPVWLDGVLYFSDFKTSPGFPSRILSYTPKTGLQVWLADGGTNGLTLDASGQHLVGARHKTKSVSVFASNTAPPKDVAAKYQGKAFNSPNDLVFRSDGTLYFTDPDFQAGQNKGQATTNVYRVSAAGEVSVVDSTIKNPNGVALSLDESALFVAGNLEDGYVKRYPIAADGSVGLGELFVQPVAVPDGMTVDCLGNLYVTEHTGRRVRVIAPDGKQIAQITGMDKNVTNVAFGGPAGKTLFITGTGGLFSIELPVAGLPY